MKEGDMVKVTDFSWSVKIEGGQLRTKWYYDKGIQEGKSRTWKILAIDCKLPSHPYGKECGKMNDTIIWSKESDEVIFAKEEYLEKIEKCPHCGQVTSIERRGEKKMPEVGNETRLVIKLLKERSKTHRDDERGLAKATGKKEVEKSVEAYCDGMLWTESELDRIIQELLQGR